MSGKFMFLPPFHYIREKHVLFLLFKSNTQIGFLLYQKLYNKEKVNNLLSNKLFDRTGDTAQW
jgi:hypothetical protein